MAAATPPASATSDAKFVAAVTELMCRYGVSQRGARYLLSYELCLRQLRAVIEARVQGDLALEYYTNYTRY